MPYSGPRLGYEQWTDLNTQIILRHHEHDPGFRVTGFSEAISWVRSPDGASYFSYTLMCKGPVQTKKGNDHATQVGSMGFSNSGDWAQRWQDLLPAQIKLMAVGPAELIRKLQRSFEVAASNTIA